MEALAFVEELGSHGQVLRRHVLARLPARVGRGYDADVIVDDPHVAAAHLEIRQGDDGALLAVDLGSRNGTLHRGDPMRIASTRIEGDDVLRIGQTQIRIRQPNQLVAPELELLRTGWRRHPATFFLSAGLFAGLVAWGVYVATFDTDIASLYAVPAMVTLALLMWTIAWSLVCRTLHGRSNFWAHGIVAFLGGAVFLAVDTLSEYLDFSIGIDAPELVWHGCLAAVVAVVLYRHLRLTARLSPRLLGAITLGIVTALLAGIEEYQALREANKPGLQAFDKTIKPGVFLLARGMAPAAFLDLADRLKARSDVATGATPRR